MTAEDLLALLVGYAANRTDAPLAARGLPDGRVLEVWAMTFGKGRLCVLPHAGSPFVLAGY